MPPRVKDVSIAFFITMAAVIIGFPLMRAIAKRIERGTPQPARIPPEMQAQIQQRFNPSTRSQSRLNEFRKVSDSPRRCSLRKRKKASS